MGGDSPLGGLRMSALPPALGAGAFPATALPAWAGMGLRRISPCTSAARPPDLALPGRGAPAGLEPGSCAAGAAQSTLTGGSGGRTMPFQSNSDASPTATEGFGPAGGACAGVPSCGPAAAAASVPLPSSLMTAGMERSALPAPLR